MEHLLPRQEVEEYFEGDSLRWTFHLIINDWLATHFDVSCSPIEQQAVSELLVWLRFFLVGAVFDKLSQSRKETFQVISEWSLQRARDLEELHRFIGDEFGAAKAC